MKIGVVSDSHDHVQLLRSALEKFRQLKVAAVIHAGDFVAPFSARLLKDAELLAGAELICIYGNNDGERRGLGNMLPQIMDGPVEIQLGGRRIALAHYIDWVPDEMAMRAEIVIGGHSHEIVNELRDGRLYLNPGECCGILTGRPTAAVIDTDTLTAKIIDLL